MKQKLLTHIIVLMMVIGLSVAIYRFGGSPSTDSEDPASEFDRDIDMSQVSYDPQDESVAAVVQGNNEFSFELYHMLSEEENIFYSPWSISTAFSMVYEGARGETEEEIRDVFGLPGDYQELRKAYGYLHDTYNTERDGYNLSTANSLWLEEDSLVLDEYRWLLINYYFAQVENVDFSDPEGTSEDINNWVEEHTNGKITDLITPDMICPINTELILVNAVYFNGLWEVPFCEDNTTDGTFVKYGGEELNVPFMHHSGHFDYTRSDGFRIMQKNYVGNDTSMLFIVPEEGDIRDMEDRITYENLERWRDELVETELDLVRIPKFTMETDYDLIEMLPGMGMPRAFTGAANFSGIDGTEELFIAEAVHKAYVDVHEEGTEAAGATGVVFDRDSLGDFFVANRPFMVIIQDNHNGNILFMGRVDVPSVGG